MEKSVKLMEPQSTTFYDVLDGEFFLEILHLVCPVFSPNETIHPSMEDDD